MASGQPANVQAYLNKHKITQLFEVRVGSTETRWIIVTSGRMRDTDDIRVLVAEVYTCVLP